MRRYLGWLSGVLLPGMILTAPMWAQITGDILVTVADPMVWSGSGSGMGRGM